MNAKPIMWLDPNMDKTRSMPTDCGLYEEWERLCLDHQFVDPEYPERRENLRLEIIAFFDSHTFHDAPLVMEQRLLLGRGAAMRGYGKIKEKPEPYYNFSEPSERIWTDLSLLGYTPSREGVLRSLRGISPESPAQPEISYLCHPDVWALFPPETKDKYDARPHPGEYKWTA